MGVALPISSPGISVAGDVHYIGDVYHSFVVPGKSDDAFGSRTTVVFLLYGSTQLTAPVAARLSCRASGGRRVLFHLKQRIFESSHQRDLDWLEQVPAAGFRLRDVLHGDGLRCDDLQG